MSNVFDQAVEVLSKGVEGDKMYVLIDGVYYTIVRTPATEVKEVELPTTPEAIEAAEAYVNGETDSWDRETDSFASSEKSGSSVWREADEVAAAAEGLYSEFETEQEEDTIVPKVEELDNWMCAATRKRKRVGDARPGYKEERRLERELYGAAHDYSAERSLERELYSSKAPKVDDGRFKTILCNNFKNGECKFGKSCCFAHGQRELRCRFGDRCLSLVREGFKCELVH